MGVDWKGWEWTGEERIGAVYEIASTIQHYYWNGQDRSGEDRTGRDGIGEERKGAVYEIASTIQH